MAASLLPSTSFNNYRIGQVCLNVHSDQLQKGIMCFSVHLQNRKCNIKLYMKPDTSISHNCVLRPFATAGSLEVDGERQGNQVSSGVLGPTNSQRSENLLDISSNPSDSMSDFERQLQELFDEVKTMIRKGNKNDAIDLLQANYEAVKEQMDAGARGIEEAAMLDIIALGYMAAEDFKIVGSLLDMLNEVVDSLKGDGPLLDSILTHMGSMYSVLGKFDRSMLAYGRALEILEGKYGNNSTVLVTPLLGMAKVLGSIGRATKAVELYHRVIAILELSRGTESEDLVVPLFGLGNLLIKEGRVTDAENPFIRILNIYKKLYGVDNERVGLAMCSLANVKCAEGNADEAIHLYRNALQVFEDSKSMASDDSIIEKTRIDLAELLHEVGRGKEGRELLEECLLITEKYRGKEHPSSVSHLINLATSYSRSKDFVKAERLLRTSLRIMMKTMGPDDQSITFPMLHLAVTLYNLNQDDEAEKLALEVLGIREKAFGKESLPVGKILLPFTFC
uniref:Putative nephrocystin-3 isoform X1 n=1 Tax=Davidia involucrata TaxID=16924 RepID=A0A5B6YP78_DAVIN